MGRQTVDVSMAGLHVQPSPIWRVRRVPDALGLGRQALFLAAGARDPPGLLSGAGAGIRRKRNPTAIGRPRSIGKLV